MHLRGVPPNAKFVGYSTASSDGYQTANRPPILGPWSYAQKFYRADLRDFVPFYEPINLSAVFTSRRQPLEDYFDANKAKDSGKLNVFFVRQSRRLQCLNGAYLSDIDDQLLTALFEASLTPNAGNKAQFHSVGTSWQLATVKARLGQSLFSKTIKSLYQYQCCFPSCHVSDPRFLVASHIARWSDNEQLRGHLGNALCLCLMHDKAFELGLFTLDEQFRIFVNPKELAHQSLLVLKLHSHQGELIKLSNIPPLGDALLEHWIRVSITP